MRLIVVRPQIHNLTGEHRSVVAEQHLRRSSHLTLLRVLPGVLAPPGGFSTTQLTLICFQAERYENPKIGPRSRSPAFLDNFDLTGCQWAFEG